MYRAYSKANIVEKIRQQGINRLGESCEIQYGSEWTSVLLISEDPSLNVYTVASQGAH